MQCSLVLTYYADCSWVVLVSLPETQISAKFKNSKEHSATPTCLQSQCARW